MANEKIGHYDRQGNPISLEQWSEFYGDMSYRFVGIDFVGDRVVASIWMGHDMMFRSPADGAEIFETTVFRLTGDTKRGIRFDDSGRRWESDDAFESRQYSTEADALTGHAELIQAVRRAN